MKKQSHKSVPPNKSEQGNPPQKGAPLSAPAQTSNYNHRLFVPESVIPRSLPPLQQHVLSDIAWVCIYFVKPDGWTYRSDSLIVKKLKERFSEYRTKWNTPKKTESAESSIRKVLRKLTSQNIIQRCSKSEKQYFSGSKTSTFGYKITNNLDLTKDLIKYMESKMSGPLKDPCGPLKDPCRTLEGPLKDPIEVEVEVEVEETTILSPTEVEVSVSPAITPRTKKVVGASPMSTPHGSTWLQKLIYEWEALREEFHGTPDSKERMVVTNAIKLVVGKLGFANGWTNSQEEHIQVVHIMRTYFQTNSGEYKAVFFYKQIKDGLLDIAQMATISMAAPTGLAYELVDPAWELTQERKEILDTIQMNYKDKASVSVRMTALGIPQAKL